MPYIKDLSVIRDSFGRKIEMFDLLYQEEHARPPFYEFCGLYKWFIVVPSWTEEYEAEIRDLAHWNVCMFSLTNNITEDDGYSVIKMGDHVAPDFVREEWEAKRDEYKEGFNQTPSQ